MPDTSADPGALAREDLSERFDRAIAEFEFEPGQPFLNLRRPDAPETDPWAPLGVRVSSFLIFPELGIGVVASDNILASPNRPLSDHAFEINPRVRFQSTWSRHSLSGEAQTRDSWYKNFPSENEDSYDAILRGRIDVLRSTNLELETSASKFQESRGSIDFPDAAAEPGDIMTERAAAAFNHTFNRLKGTLRGAISEIDYSDAVEADDVPVNNDDRDYRQNELGLRVSYEFNPGMIAFTDVERNNRRFRLALDDDGFNRDSDGWEAVAGLRFDFSTIVTGELSLGYALQNPKDAAFVDVEGAIINAAIFWRPTALTTLRFEARSAIEQTTTLDSAGALTRAYLIGIEHALRRNIILGGFIGFAESDYAGSDLVEERLTGGLTIEYRLNRSVAIEGSWQHISYDAGAVNSEYRENEFRLGMRFRR